MTAIVPCVIQSEIQQATISYGQQLDAEQLMVLYGFSAPPTASLPRPLLDSGALRDLTAKTTVAAAEEADEEGQEGGSWGEEHRRVLMDELLVRAQQRFAREAAGNIEQFETKV